MSQLVLHCRLPFIYKQQNNIKNKKQEIETCLMIIKSKHNFFFSIFRNDETEKIPEDDDNDYTYDDDNDDLDGFFNS